MELAKWISELGLPVGLLIFGVVCAARVARFFAPLITHVAEKHVELIDTLKDHSRRQTEILLSQNKLLTEHGQLLNQIRLAVVEGVTTETRRRRQT
jgi:hypothetical protein